MCYFAKCLSFLYVAVVGLMLLSQPAWADSKKDNCDRQFPNLTNWAIANSFRAVYLAWDTIANCHETREFDFDDYPLESSTEH